MAVGDYEKLERARRAAWRRQLSTAWGSREHEEQTRLHEELSVRRVTYLHDLLAQLPFRWHIEHAYTPRETALYGGADHIVVDEAVRHRAFATRARRRTVARSHEVLGAFSCRGRPVADSAD